MSKHPNHRRAEILRSLEIGQSHVEEVEQQTCSIETFRVSVCRIGMRLKVRFAVKVGERGEFIATRLRKRIVK